MKPAAEYITYLIFFLLSYTSLWANIRVPAVIGSHMVLQQKSEVRIWGWCDVSEQVKLKANWDTSTYTTTGSTSAKWEIKISTPDAGGPYQIAIQGNNRIILDDVLIGEVWICSGQSNMEMSMTGDCLTRMKLPLQRTRTFVFSKYQEQRLITHKMM